MFNIYSNGAKLPKSFASYQRVSNMTREFPMGSVRHHCDPIRIESDSAEKGAQHKDCQLKTAA